MATLVTFHAHPDDEAIATAGTMAKAAAAGHRVVLVVATKGERGEVPEGFLRPGEALWERRVKETHASARLLGVARVEFLGYVDSGMAGRPENDHPSSFWRADVEEAATRLANILIEEGADVLTVYDDHGNYGHPDHVQVHRVGLRAAELAGTPRVYEATADRDRIKQFRAKLEELDPELGARINLDTLGTPSALITTRIDVSDQIETKRAAMAAHASQIAETSFFLALPLDQFAATFGIENFVRRGVPSGTVETSLFDNDATGIMGTSGGPA
jgi:LmbE family N-acetylglucosaminyl deacetylase